MSKNQPQPSAVDKVVKKAQDFELSLADVRRKSEKRAWWVAGVSVFMSLCMMGGLFYVLPLKEKIPYLVMADAYTGQATVARLSGDWKDTPITASEAINKSNVSHFVVSRESFDSVLLGLRDWNTVFAMSSPSVSNEYRSLLSRQNPTSPFLVYGEQRSVRVKVLSIVLTGGNPAVNKSPTGATVRFQRFIYSKQNGGTQYLDNKLATLAFTYKSNLKMGEQHRIENPLGFQVTSYRVDSDVSTAPAPGDIVVAEKPTGAASAPVSGGLPDVSAPFDQANNLPTQGAH